MKKNTFYSTVLSVDYDYFSCSPTTLLILVCLAAIATWKLHSMSVYKMIKNLTRCSFAQAQRGKVAKFSLFVYFLDFST